MTTQCRPCPWRDDHPLVPDDLVEYARTDPDGFVCHTRCGPCPGPRLLFAAEGRSRQDQPEHPNLDVPGRVAS